MDSTQSFRLDHILPVASTKSVSIPADSVALSGPLLVSSLLHLALHHLRARHLENSETDIVGGMGDVERRVLILSPSQEMLYTALADENDASLSRGFDGETARLLDSIEMKFLPTSAHLTYFLTTIHTSATLPSTLNQPPPNNINATADPSYLSTPPTLVILHNPSSYLSEPLKASGGLEAYGSVLALFVSAFNALSTPSPPFLVLHDAEASTKTLPVIPPHRSPKNKRQGDGTEERIYLKRIASHFFDLDAVVSSMPMSPTSVLDESYTRFELVVSPNRGQQQLQDNFESLRLQYMARKTVTTSDTSSLDVEAISW